MASKSLSEVAPYPEPTATQKRYVIWLEPKGDDIELNDYKVEIIAGKNQMVDIVNHHMLMGKINEETLQGWGYTYFVVDCRDAGAGGMAMTRMASDPTKKVEKFVPLFGEAMLVRYNSKLPIVVYCPQGMEVRYRIWNTKQTSIPCKEQ